MRPHSLLALTLAASIALPASAGDGKLGPSEALFLSTVSVVSVLVLLPYHLGHTLSEKLSSEKMQGKQQWEVTNVATQGERTAVELRSEDRELKIDMTVATRIAQSQGLRVHDQVDIAPIGKAGYAVSKGTTTIGVLAQPGSGMIHSTVRN